LNFYLWWENVMPRAGMNAPEAQRLCRSDRFSKAGSAAARSISPQRHGAVAPRPAGVPGSLPVRFISVTIPEADIVHCGDTCWNGIHPFIDYSTGGNIDGMIKAAEVNVVR
jgi:hypothetical protein